MPATQKDHWDFTIREWTNGNFAKILKEAFKDGDIKIIYDIGACVGGWSHVVLTSFPGIEKIYCFEPAQDNFEYLLTQMPPEKVYCLDGGIYYGKTESKVWGREGDGNIGARFVEGIDDTGVVLTKLRPFKLRTLEELELQKPELIKMDVEGAEKNIIEHSEIVKNCKYLLIEWHDDSMKAKEFFGKHLPNHAIVDNIQNGMYLLCLKSQS